MKKVILITGASAGIGKATALQLIAEGHTVYGAARRTEKMQDIAERGGKILELDVTNHEQNAAVINAIIQNEGRIDVLVNNAGYAIYGAIEDTSIEDARRQFEVNIFGLANLTQLVLPHMRKQQSGKIINISSMAGKVYMPLGGWYHATKHALEGWSDALRLEVKPFGIDVVIIEPGIISTEFGDVMIQPMVERSGKGAYADITMKMAAASKKSYEPGQSSSPDVIAKVIMKAVVAKKPKTRYVAGKKAKLAMTSRKWLSDRFFDKFILMEINQAK